MPKTEILNERLTLYLLAGIIGLASGLTAVLFRWLVLGVGTLFATIPVFLGPVGWVIAPVIGGLIVAIIVVRYAPEAKGHGVPEVMASYATQGGKMRVRVPLLKSIASAFSIGSGGSCGREGPIAQIGAGLGSTIAGLANMNRRQTKTLLVCGLASGVSATFNAPLGGMIFGIEVIAGGIVGFSIIPVILSCVVATAISLSILGAEVSFQAPLFSMGTPLELVFYLILGLLFGIGSVLWTRGFYKVEDALDKLPVSKYLLPGIGGLLTGVLLLLTIYLENALGYSGLFRPGEPYFPAIVGLGYAFTDAILIGTVTLGALLAFGFLKALATSFTLGSGGSGGVFAPTLTIGAAFGGALGLVFSVLFPWAVAQPMAFALVGMAALFAGTARAPITCIVILMEMTNDYSLILPLMISVSASFLIASLLDDESIYTLKLARRGITIRQGAHIGALKAIGVEEVMTTSPTILRPSMSRQDVLNIIDKTQHTKYPVVDINGNVVGTLIAEDLHHDVEGIPEPTVEDLMNSNFLHLAPICTMDSVLSAMMKRGEGHAVIVNPDEPTKMLGFVTKADVLRAYELAIFRLQQQGYDIEEIGPADVIDVA
ncbi:MAG: chloride channel protein [Candidatus Thorarchaeota archaeon]|nr:chloride channel protein [Candidatus Thorarchaeota archaeon]